MLINYLKNILNDYFSSSKIVLAKFVSNFFQFLLEFNMITNLSQNAQNLLEDFSKNIKKFAEDPATDASEIILLMIALYSLIREYIKKWF